MNDSANCFVVVFFNSEKLRIGKMFDDFIVEQKNNCFIGDFSASTFVFNDIVHHKMIIPYLLFMALNGIPGKRLRSF